MALAPCLMPLSSFRQFATFSADWNLASCNVYKTMILLYFESAYVVYKNIQNGANYKGMGPPIHWVSPCSSGSNQTCQFHIVNQKNCTSDGPYYLKCKGCQLPLKNVILFQKVWCYHFDQMCMQRCSPTSQCWLSSVVHAV